MKQVLLRKGSVIVDEVPAPVVGRGQVLVEVAYSLISTGTEISVVGGARKSLLKKVLENPDNIKKVFGYLKNAGIKKTVDTVKNKIESGQSLGYSCSGIVIGVGEGVSGFKIGDKAACAGAGKANHAEVVVVPENLAVNIPQKCELKDAASVTIGAIAMQGVRRASLSLGETVAVTGLGLLGQLTVQILKAAGCRVIGIDVDLRRVETAKRLGADFCFMNNPSVNNDIANITGGFGVDSTILTASSESDELVQQAMEITRKKGKVVVVGAVGLSLKRAPFYEKEIDFLISCSYGPGRYDPLYEEKGLDYPYAYVRWTEKRNMEEYLRLVAERKVNFKALIDKEYPVDQAHLAYEQLSTLEDKPIGVLLSYGIGESVNENKFSNKVVFKKIQTDTGKINVAVVGAGSFANAMHLPNLKQLNNIYHIRAVSGRTASRVKNIAKQYQADYCATDYEEILKDDKVDMVLISTRHNLHAEMASKAAKAGKAVFLEKPMALNKEELNELVAVLEETKVPFTVGFNRRFSLLARKIKEITEKRINPMIINYRMNAGFIPKEHWCYTEEGGGRNIGEACHIYDLFNFFTESKIKEISAHSISPQTEQYSRNDNFIATISYEDGSVCNLTYTALGSKDLSKEKMDIYFDGKVVCLNDYRELKVFGAKGYDLKTKFQDKGHLQCLEEFGESLSHSNIPPMPLNHLIQATEISFEVEKKIGKI